MFIVSAAISLIKALACFANKKVFNCQANPKQEKLSQLILFWMLIFEKYRAVIAYGSTAETLCFLCSK